jgi:hypothetical protein
MKTKMTILTSITLITVSALKAQILAPSKWSYAVIKTGKNEAVVFFNATIKVGLC